MKVSRFPAAAAAGLVIAFASPGTALAQPPACFGETPTIVATPGEQTWGTDGRDVIRGTDGRDEIFSGGGDDLICGGWGDDYINPHGGRDRVRAGEGDDLVWARDEEADDIDGGRGNDGAAIDQGADAINDVEDSDF